MGTPRRQDRSLDVPDERWDSVGELFTEILNRIRSTLTSPHSVVGMTNYDAFLSAWLENEADVISLAHYLELKRSIPAQQEIGRLLGRPVEGRMLRDLATVVGRLREHYEPEVIPDWLEAESPDLGGQRPVDLVRQRRLAEVLAALEAQTSGSFA